MSNLVPQFSTERFQKMLAHARRHDAAEFARFDSADDDAKKLSERLLATGRLDASESVFFARQLEQIRPGIMEVQYTELLGKTLVPTETNIDPGATHFTVQKFDRTGRAKVVASLDTNIPRADVSAGEGSQIIRSVVSSYGYSIQESRAAAMARTPLIPMRAMAARDAIERELDNVIMYGDTVMGLSGLLTLSGTETYTVPNGALGTKTFETKSPNEILADLNGIVNRIIVQSKGIERPNTLLLPLSSYTYIQSLRMGDGDSRTVLQFFKDNQPGLDVQGLFHLEAAPAAEWTGKRMVCYRKDPSKLVFLLPVAFEQMAPQMNDFTLVTNCHARTGGVGVYAPKSVAYGDGI